IGESPEIPAEHALQGLDGVHAYSRHPDASAAFLSDVLAMRTVGESRWEARGEKRGGWYQLDASPAERRRFGGGVVQHVAWGCRRVNRYEIDRRAYGIGYPEQAALKDTYGGVEGMVFLECHHLVPTGVSSYTVLIFSHPIGGGAYLPMVTELARCGNHVIYAN